MSFVIDKTVTDKAPKKTVVSQFTGNNSRLVAAMEREQHEAERAMQG
jgi:hypothetical protein